ncbi:MAG: hypothetical protein KY461_02760 [Actinobacteria bacterium]|nr:hypothetical protein [Actinomycetota bacterium]
MSEEGLLARASNLLLDEEDTVGHRRASWLAMVVAAAGISATPAAEEWSASAGGWVSGDVAYVETIAEEAGGAVDAVLHDDLLYVTSFRSFSIYDVSDPGDPERLATEPVIGGLYNEQPQTNGEILLISRDVQPVPPSEHARRGAALDIYDVSDPTSPEHLATYHARMTGEAIPPLPFQRTERDHLWTCVLDCTFAYSAGGTILDLSDPSAPEHVGRWTDVAPHKDANSIHHVGEVAPGIVLTGGLPMYVLDASVDPADPVVLATFAPATTMADPVIEDPFTFYRGNPETLPARSSWPGGLEGRLAVVSMETPLVGNCTERAGDVQTFRAVGWGEAGEEPRFVPADRFVLDTNGTYTDGAPPHNVWGCSAYGMQVHPDFGPTGGTTAVAFFEHGIRVLDVDQHGDITERGGFVPVGGVSTAPRWLGDGYLYVTDIHRGVDILRVA